MNFFTTFSCSSPEKVLTKFVPIKENYEIIMIRKEVILPGNFLRKFFSSNC